MLNETPAEAARRAIERGRQPVPVLPKDKKPRGNEWQIRRLTANDFPDLPAIFTPDGNIGLMLGPASGGLTDIDLDCPEAAALASTFLPVTDMVHGRATNPLSHWWYLVTDETLEYKKYIDENGATLLELRASDGKKGFQTVIPPSIHKTGEQLEWAHPDGEPARVSALELRVKVAFLASASILARAFPAHGQRHEFCLALAGGIIRAGASEDDAYVFIYEVARVGGSADPAARANVVYSTARKLADGDAEVTGWNRLSEIIGGDRGKKVVDKVREWLDCRDDARHEALRAFVEQSIRGKVTVTSSSLPQTSPAVTPDPADVSILDKGQDDVGSGVDAALAALKRNDRGQPIACGINAHIILTKVPGISFRFNDVDKCVVAGGEFETTPSETLDVTVTHWIADVFDLHISKGEVADAILRIAMDNRFDPIRDYLRGLKWDGVPRLSAGGGWLCRYGGVSLEGLPEGYVEFAGRKWILSTVARGVDPGCKADLVLMLRGEQGVRKSSLLEALGGKWYVDLAIALGDKDSKMAINSAWISELPDLAALKRAGDQNAIKAFFTIRRDKFRLPYGRAISEFPRRNVFAGTTNDDYYLSDPTGNRRYVCVTTDGVDLEAVLLDRDQLFAEAMVLYDRHVRECTNKLKCCCWWFTEEEAKIAEAQANRHTDEHPAEEIIAEWWSGLPVDKRPEYVTTTQVAKEAFDTPKERITHGLKMQIGQALQRWRVTVTEEDGTTRSVKAFERGEADVHGRRAKVYFASAAVRNVAVVVGPQRKFPVFNGGRK